MRMGNGEGFTNKELHSLPRSPNIISVIKCRRLKWATHVAIMEEGKSAVSVQSDRNAYKIYSGL